MKVLLDTSILVAALVQSHVAHALAAAWLKRVQTQEVTGFVAAHTLAEVYAVLTRLPLKPPVSPATAWQSLQTQVVAYVQVVALSPDDYQTTLNDLAALNIGGGQTYDALIAKAALVADVDHLVTLNAKHFRTLFPGLAERILDPAVPPMI